MIAQTSSRDIFSLQYFWWLGCLLPLDTLGCSLLNILADPPLLPSQPSPAEYHSSLTLNTFKDWKIYPWFFQLFEIALFDWEKKYYYLQFAYKHIQSFFALISGRIAAIFGRRRAKWLCRLMQISIFWLLTFQIGSLDSPPRANPDYSSEVSALSCSFWNILCALNIAFLHWETTI